MLKQLDRVPDEALPLAQLRAQLRLGTGFSDDGLQDDLLRMALRAAMTLIETHCTKALLQRQFELRAETWQDPQMQTLPRAPVREIVQVSHTDGDGTEQIAPPETYRLVEDTHRPELRARGTSLPGGRSGGQRRVVFSAGYGPVWSDLPEDLAMAVLQLAVQFYERRGGEDDPVPLPAAVIRLLAPYRNLRLVGGSRS